MAPKCDSIEELRKADTAFVRDKADPVLVQEIQSSLKNITVDNGSYTIVQSGVEKDYLQNKLKVLSLGQHRQWGRLNNIHQNLVEFFGKHVVTEEDVLKKTIAPIERILASFTKAVGEETGYLIVRSQLPCETEETHKARWHTDGSYYDPMPSNRYKLVIALNGRSTLLSKPTEADRQKYAELEPKARELEHAGKKDEARKLYRNELDKYMKDNVQTLSFEDCSRAVVYHYNVYSGDNGLLHSEPIFDRHRIFVSVVPGPVAGLRK